MIICDLHQRFKYLHSQPEKIDIFSGNCHLEKGWPGESLISKMSVQQEQKARERQLTKSDTAEENKWAETLNER